MQQRQQEVAGGLAWLDLMATTREAAYLETDGPEDVGFYGRFGFEMVGEQEMLGVPNWFMLRRSEGRRE